MSEMAVLWTPSSGVPRKLGDIQLIDCCKPHLRSMIPPRHAGNIQRRIQQLLFEKRGLELRGRPLIEQDWLSLIHFGHNGIGALDVFPTDHAANEYYAKRVSQHSWDDLPSLVRFALNTATISDIQRVMEIPATGIPGVQPKVMLDEWIVKLNSPSFPGLLALESLAYALHRQAGCEVPETQLFEVEGMQVLASRRFDRDAGIAIPLESVYSIMESRDPGRVQCNTDASVEDVFCLLRALRSPEDSQPEAYRRFILAVLTGNGDQHLENISVLGSRADSKLSPLYDPAPMRAYRGRPNYDLLSALPFTGIAGVQPSKGVREFAESGATPPDLRKRVLQLAEDAGLSKEWAEDEVDRLLHIADDYIEDAITVLRDAVPPGYSGRMPDITGFEATLRQVRAALE